MDWARAVMCNAQNHTINTSLPMQLLTTLMLCKCVRTVLFADNWLYYSNVFGAPICVVNVFGLLGLYVRDLQIHLGL